MRKILILVITLVHILSTNTSALGVVKRDKCKTVLSQIQNENKIANNFVDKHNKLIVYLNNKENYSVEREHEYWGLMINMIESIILANQYIVTSSSCFNTSAQTEARSALTIYGDLIKDFRKNYRNYPNNYGFKWKKIKYFKIHQYANENRS